MANVEHSILGVTHSVDNTSASIMNFTKVNAKKWVYWNTIGQSLKTFGMKT
jgi:hypothetical protein